MESTSLVLELLGRKWSGAKNEIYESWPESETSWRCQRSWQDGKNQAGKVFSIWLEKGSGLAWWGGGSYYFDLREHSRDSDTIVWHATKSSRPGFIWHSTSQKSKTKSQQEPMQAPNEPVQAPNGLIWRRKEETQEPASLETPVAGLQSTSPGSGRTPPPPPPRPTKENKTRAVSKEQTTKEYKTRSASKEQKTKEYKTRAVSKERKLENRNESVPDGRQARRNSRSMSPLQGNMASPIQWLSSAEEFCSWTQPDIEDGSQLSLTKPQAQQFAGHPLSGVPWRVIESEAASNSIAWSKVVEAGTAAAISAARAAAALRAAAAAEEEDQSRNLPNLLHFPHGFTETSANAMGTRPMLCQQGQREGSWTINFPPPGIFWKPGNDAYAGLQ